MVGGGEGHQLLHFGLRVEARAGIEHVVHRRTLAALGDETRIFLNLDAPSLIVHEMEVQGVELVARHFRNDLLQASERNESAARVDHQFANASARCVGDEHRSELCRLRGEELVERHEAIIYSRGRTADDANALFVHREGIAFGIAHSDGVDRELQGRPTSQYAHTGAFAQHATCHAGLVVESGSGFDAPDARHLKGDAGAFLKLCGQGNERIFLCAHFFAQRVGFCGQIGRGHAVEGGKAHHFGLCPYEMHLAQAGAAVEGRRAHLFQTGGEGDARQTTASQERLITDFAELGGENHFAQVAATEKSIVGNLGHISLAEIQFLELRAKVAQLSEIAVAAGGECAGECQLRHARFLCRCEIFELRHADGLRNLVGHRGCSGLRIDRKCGHAAQGKEKSFHGKGLEESNRAESRRLRTVRERKGRKDSPQSANTTRRVPSGSSSMSTRTALSGNSGSMSSGHSMKHGAPE